MPIKCGAYLEPPHKNCACPSQILCMAARLLVPMHKNWDGLANFEAPKRPNIWDIYTSSHRHWRDTPLSLRHIAHAPVGRVCAQSLLKFLWGGCHIAMTMLNRQMIQSGTMQLRESLERSVTRLSRTHLAQIEALREQRSKAQQTARVTRRGRLMAQSDLTR